MTQTDKPDQAPRHEGEHTGQRKPYTPPTVETLGGTLTTLLASSCQCPTCPPDPDANSV